MKQIIIAVLLLLFIACKKDDVPTPDPPVVPRIDTLVTANFKRTMNLGRKAKIGDSVINRNTNFRIVIDSVNIRYYGANLMEMQFFDIYLKREEKTVLDTLALDYNPITLKAYHAKGQLVKFGDLLEDPWQIVPFRVTTDNEVKTYNDVDNTSIQQHYKIILNRQQKRDLGF